MRLNTVPDSLLLACRNLKRKLLPVFLLLTVASTCPAAAWDFPWRPMTPEERDMKASSIDPEAGAEVLEKDVVVNFVRADNLARADCYVRIKVFNQRGVDALNPVSLISEVFYSAWNIQARVIQADGSVTMLDQKTVYCRNVLRYEGIYNEANMFALPNVKPGCVVEYKWTEYSSDWRSTIDYLSNTFLEIADRFPVKDFKMTIFDGSDHQTLHFNTYMVPNQIQKNSGGRWTVELHDVPVTAEEPFLPSYFGTRPWICVHAPYVFADENAPDFWAKYGRGYSGYYERVYENGGLLVSPKVRELLNGVKDRTEKLRRIYNLCNHDIVNLSATKCGISIADRMRIRNSGTPSNTLYNKKGTGFDIDDLFIAMVREAGFEAYFARCNNKPTIPWNINCHNSIMTQGQVIAVKNGKDWDYFQPDTPYLPFGMLNPGCEGTVALICDGNREKKAVFGVTPATPCSKSQIQRKGEFVLGDDGSLKGKASIVYTGHESLKMKNKFAEIAADKTEDAVKDDIHKRLPTADVTNVRIQNITDPEKDVEIDYDISIPDYADMSGDRLFLQPAFFQKNEPAVFTKEKRTWDIRFPYAWESHDKVKITCPAGFDLEEGEAPKSVLDTAKLAYTVKLGVSKDHKVVVYERNEKINVLDVSKEYYAEIKAIFDAMHEQDGHVLTLHHVPAPSTGNAPSTPADAKK